MKLFLKSLMVENDVAIKPLSLISRSERNAGADEEGVYLMDATYEKDFTVRNSGKSFFLVWKVMQICYQLLGIGKQATQREIFYNILSTSSSYITSQNQVNSAIQDAVAVLLCTRRSLGILASSKGAVVGRLVIKEHGGDTVDCSNLGSSSYPISADMNMKQHFYSDARYILVIEKDAIFQRLVEERFFLKVPCIIMTAKGFPDLASRALLHRLHQEFPSMLIFALVDWNPAGLAIICTYRFGSIRMGLEAPRYVCDVKWLGLRNRDALTYVPATAFTSLTDRDMTQARSLLASKMLQNHKQYKQEILEMLTFGQKAEIEALYAHGYEFLAKFITKKIVRQDFI
nr:meiotic recombination protein SPO11-2-like isoform X2 [Physcomitrium patens]|eukprot:XP_024396453.1 meiotic recombination protein SPO11-2-like isoform X2 [Physcomitrella patens]